ncbi:MAG: HPr family phosphocarrier protein [Lachnospiraceae bacterium]|nr:HPr family phosphocarrier protein [Lachnospiraceae bacterium]
MVSFDYVITDPVGIHARPAGLLSKEAKKYADSKIELTNQANGKTASVKALIALMSIGVAKGNTVTVSVEGGDEAAVAAEMEKFFKENL